MAPFKHYYYCRKCAQKVFPKIQSANGDLGGDVSEFSAKCYSETIPAFAQAPVASGSATNIQHFEAQRQAKYANPPGQSAPCQTYLTYLGWVDLARGVDLNSIKSRLEARIDKEGVQTQVEVGVISIVWDVLTHHMFVGSSGDSTKARPNLIQAGIFAKINDVYDKDKMIFGRGCAEVDALEKLLAYRAAQALPTTAASVRGCRFIARNKTNKDLRSMCNNCQNWTQAFGLIDVRPA
jgi:hypothetical protein